MTESQMKAIREANKALVNLIAESDFVLKGGDDPHDQCQECGLAPVGMWRDSLKEARKSLTALQREFGKEIDT